MSIRINLRALFDFFMDMLYSGCKKNVPLLERLLLQPLIPSFRIAEPIFEKRYGLGMKYPAASNGISIGVHIIAPRGGIKPSSAAGGLNPLHKSEIPDQTRFKGYSAKVATSEGSHFGAV